jgi:hypothetical protein
MSNSQKFSPIRDFVVVASLLSTLLYTVGYLHETSYLEGFGFNNSELIPDLQTSITLGFRYVFLNATYTLLLASLISFTILLTVNQIKEEFLEWLEKKDKLNRMVQKVISSINFRTIKVYLLILSPIIIFFILYDSISKGTALAESIKQKPSLEIIEIMSLSQKTKHTGSVIRIRDGIVAFWDKPSGSAHLYNLNSIVGISHVKNSP